MGLGFWGWEDRRVEERGNVGEESEEKSIFWGGIIFLEIYRGFAVPSDRRTVSAYDWLWLERSL